MSVDREYKIRISTVTEGSAAGQTADDLKKVGKAGEEAGEGLKFFEFHGSEMRRLVHELDRIIPGVGLALKVAFNPAALGIGGTVLLIEQVKSALEEYNKKLDEIGEAAAKADFAAGIQAALDVTRAAVEEQEKYLHNLHEIEKGEHGVALELNHQLQLIAAIEAAKQAQADADKTLALAKLKEQEVTGGVSPSQAIIKRAQIEEKYVREKRAAEDRKFKEEQDARINAHEAAVNKQAELDRRQLETSTALAEARRKKNSAIADIPKPEDIEAATKANEEAQANADKQRKEHERFPLNDIIQRRAEEAQFEAERAKKSLDLLLELKKRGEDAKNTSLTPLENSAADAKKAAEDNAKAEADARDKANQAQREHDAASGANAGADKSTNAATEAQARTELMNRARALQKEFKNEGGSMSKADVTELLQLMRLLGEKFFEQGQEAVTKKQFQQELTALRRLIEAKGK